MKNLILGALAILALTVTPALARNDRTPVTICHKPGTPAEHTITVDDNALPAHLAHGDYIGACITTTETPHGTEPPAIEHTPRPGLTPPPTDTE